MTGAVRRIDSHLHLWQLERGDYDWVTPEAGALYASFTPEQAAVQLAESGVDGAILVQAADTLTDTEYMLDVADANDWVLGVVGWVQLDDPALAARQLDRWQQNPRFCGVRSLVHTDPRPDLLELEPVRDSLRELSDRGLAFDVPDAWPGQLAQATRLARDLPELTVVIDHLAKPPRERADFADWREELARTAAASPRVVAKVSGLRLADTEYSASALETVWNIALELFGPSRLLWGSDWPVTVPSGGYAPTFDVLRELVSTLSAGEQADVYGRTASRAYSLKG